MIAAALPKSVTIGRWFAWTVVAAGLASMLAMSRPAPSLLLAAVALLMMHLAVVRMSVAAVVCLSMVLVMSSSTYLERSGSTGLAGLARVVGIVVVGAFVWRQAGTPESPRARARIPRAAGIYFSWVLIAGLLVYLFFATVPHGLYAALAVYGAGAATTIFYWGVLSRCASGQEIRRGAVVAFTSVLLASILFVVVRPDEGMLGGRLQGLTSNPNLLGFYCVLLIALLLSYARFTLYTFTGLIIAGGVLVSTASRSSALASALIVVINLAIRRGWTRPALVVTIVLMAMAVPLGMPEWFTGLDTPMLRTENSRLESYQYTMEVLRVSPWRGVGFNAETVQVASTPLRALTHAGFGGGVGVLLMYSAILFFSIRAGSRTLAFGGAMISHSLFEGWLLSPIGPMMICFVVVWHALSKIDQERPAGAGRPSMLDAEEGTSGATAKMSLP